MKGLRHRVLDDGEPVLCGSDDIEEGMCVYIDDSGSEDVVAPTTGGDDEPIGFAYDDYEEGDEVVVYFFGESPAIASEEIDPGDVLTPDDGGKVQVDDSTSTHYPFAKARTYAPGDDAELTVTMFGNFEANS